MKEHRTIHYNGYLTHERLYDLLCNQLNLKVTKEVKVPNTRYKYDFVVELENKNIAIEFDGLYHFTLASNIIRDNKKDLIWLEKTNNVVVRIPYFVQLTTETFQYYFSLLDLKVDVIQDFPHGFVDKKACLPANFCSLGVVQYNKILENLPNSVVTSIKLSLKNWEGKKDYFEIYPV